MLAKKEQFLRRDGGGRLAGKESVSSGEKGAGGGSCSAQGKSLEEESTRGGRLRREMLLRMDPRGISLGETQKG